MATPENNTVNRTLVVMANLLNREVSLPADTAFVMRIIDAFLEWYSSEVQELFDDPENLTNAQKAGFFLKKMKDLAKEEVLRKKAERHAKRNMLVSAREAGNTAASDLD